MDLSNVIDILNENNLITPDKQKVMLETVNKLIRGKNKDLSTISKSKNITNDREILNNSLSKIKEDELPILQYITKQNCVGDLKVLFRFVDLYIHKFKINTDDDKSITKEKNKLYTKYLNTLTLDETQILTLLVNRNIISDLCYSSNNVIIEHLDTINDLKFDFYLLKDIYKKILSNAASERFLKKNKHVGTVLEVYKEGEILSKELSEYSKERYDLYSKYSKKISEDNARSLCELLYLMTNGTCTNDDLIDPKYIFHYLIGFGCVEQDKFTPEEVYSLQLEREKYLLVVCNFINILLNSYFNLYQSNISYFSKGKAQLKKTSKYRYLKHGKNIETALASSNTLTSMDISKFIKSIDHIQGLEDDYINLVDDSLLPPIGIIDDTSIDIDKLYKRKFITPSSGIIILNSNHQENIYFESMYIKEFHIGGISNIVTISRYFVSGEYYEIPSVLNLLEDSNNKTSMWLIGMLNGPLQYLYDVFDIDKSANLECEIISPYYWKYRNKVYMTDNERSLFKNNKAIKREFSVDIAPYFRSIDGTPSEEALSLTNQLCINIPKGKTLVKPHTRTYNKRNLVMN